MDGGKSVVTHKIGQQQQPPPTHVWEFFKESRENLAKFHVEVQEMEKSPAKVGVNGRPTKMVPTTEVRKEKSPLANNTSEMINGPTKNVNGYAKLMESASLREILLHF
ncbi:protein ACTIVITY OF BC1 COMPLEX KINASE 7 [Forsythia ovata]|uniref:Protein ACTIVITY OF BC1 COMPLEX KINASE 7 n=1 Tax=Forsythia ovata TaxID=205694 RepID=A0ABD1VNN7_9LAMI